MPKIMPAQSAQAYFRLQSLDLLYYDSYVRTTGSITSLSYQVIVRNSGNVKHTDLPEPVGCMPSSPFLLQLNS